LAPPAAKGVTLAEFTPSRQRDDSRRRRQLLGVAFLEQLPPSNVETRVDDLRRELRALDAKIQNLTAAVKQGGANLPSIIALLAQRQKERDVLVAEIGSAETLHQIHADRSAIDAKVQSAVAD
jgi:multidrug resistance efflux pump